MVITCKNINIKEYGLAVERSEGQLYLMKRVKDKGQTQWADSVGAKLNSGWFPTLTPYRIFWNDVKVIRTGQKSALVEALREIESRNK